MVDVEPLAHRFTKGLGNHLTRYRDTMVKDSDIKILQDMINSKNGYWLVHKVVMSSMRYSLNSIGKKTIAKEAAQSLIVKERNRALPSFFKEIDSVKSSLDSLKESVKSFSYYMSERKNAYHEEGNRVTSKYRKKLIRTICRSFGITQTDIEELYISDLRAKALKFISSRKDVGRPKSRPIRDVITKLRKKEGLD